MGQGTEFTSQEGGGSGKRRNRGTQYGKQCHEMEEMESGESERKWMIKKKKRNCWQKFRKEHKIKDLWKVVRPA